MPTKREQLSAAANKLASDLGYEFSPRRQAEPIALSIPLRFAGISSDVEVLVDALEVEAPAGTTATPIDVDITDLEGAVTVATIQIPPEFALRTDPQIVLARKKEADKPITLRVPLRFASASAEVEVVLDAIDVQAPAGAVASPLDVDLADLPADSLTTGMIPLPAGLTLQTDPQRVVARKKPPLAPVAQQAQTPAQREKGDAGTPEFVYCKNMETRIALETKLKLLKKRIGLKGRVGQSLLYNMGLDALAELPEQRLIEIALRNAQS